MALSVMKLKGINSPRKTKKAAKDNATKAGSRKGLTKSVMEKGRGEGGRRERTVRLEIVRRPRMMKPQTRMVHGKPIFGIRFWTKMGNMTPPREEPEAIIPRARARRLWNQVTTVDMAG